MKKLKDILVSESLKYHINRKIPMMENVFRFASTAYFDIISEAKKLYKSGKYIPLTESEKDFLNSEVGEFGIYGGEKVPLDLPMIETELLDEAEYQGRDVELNKPKRGGSKKFYVYVKDPKSGNVKKVSFGAADGGGKLSVKFKNPKRRKAFADRHNCKDKKDKTKPGYWSCRLPRYAKSLGLGSNMNTYW